MTFKVFFGDFTSKRNNSYVSSKGQNVMRTDQRRQKSRTSVLFPTYYKLAALKNFFQNHSIWRLF